MEEFCCLVGGLSVVTITLIVTGVLLFCANVGGLILAIFVKRGMNKQKTPIYDDIYAPSASQISLHLYEEVRTRPSQVTNLSCADKVVRSSYISVQYDADVGSDGDNAKEYVNVAV
jgi:hypothetical protein